MDAPQLGFGDDQIRMFVMFLFNLEEHRICNFCLEFEWKIITALFKQIISFLIEDILDLP